MVSSYEARKKRIMEMLGEIQREKEVPFEDFIVKYALNFGLTRRKVEDYLKILEAAKIISIDSGKIRAIE